MEIEPHGSALFAVNYEHGIQLYDANIRINSLQIQERMMSLETDYKKNEAELMLSVRPKSIKLNGQEISFVIQNQTAIFDVEGAGRLTITF